MNQNRDKPDRLPRLPAGGEASKLIAIGSWELSFGGRASQLLWSDEIFRILGYDRGDIEVSVSAFFNQVHKDDHRPIRRAVVGTLRHRQPCSIVHRITRADGEERMIYETARIVADDVTGRVLKMIGTAHDITEQLRAEQALRSSEHQFASAFEHAAIGMCLVALDGRFIRVNRALSEMLGYSATELLGKRFQEITHAEDIDEDEGNVVQLLSGEVNSFQMEKRYAHKLGDEVWALLSVSLLRDEAGLPVHFISQIQDMTERKKMEQQFLRAQRIESIGTLAGGIAHDLNNVLAPIMMSIDLLRAYVDNPRGREILDLVDSSARRGAEMVSQVLTFAKGAEGKTSEVRIEEIFRDLLRIVEETFPKDLKVRSSIDPEAWLIQGDSTQIHQVILNLCVNSRDAMPDGGTLTLRASNVRIDEHYAAMNLEATPGDYLKVEIEDTGHGIPADIIEKLFDPFFTTKEPGKGTGLGLSTSLAIIKSHGGFIRLYSEPGRGALFRLYLPASPLATGAVNGVAENLEIHPGKGKTILIVDDEHAIREICRQTLEARGYRTLLAKDGAEGVSMYAMFLHDIALVITDMMMPVMNGHRAIQELKRHNPSIRIICTSGIGSHGDVAANEGYHFIAKPFSAETLLLAIQRRLDEDEYPVTTPPPTWNI